MELVSKSPIKRVTIEAVILRADGSHQDLGVIADSAWKWYKPSTWKMKKAAKQRIDAANAGVGG